MEGDSLEPDPAPAPLDPVLPDNFALFVLAGSACLWATGRGLCDGQPLWFELAGLAAGFSHLARVDGLRLAGVSVTAALAPVYFPFPAAILLLLIWLWRSLEREPAARSL